MTEIGYSHVMNWGRIKPGKTVVRMNSMIPKGSLSGTLEIVADFLLILASGETTNHYSKNYFGNMRFDDFLPNPLTPPCLPMCETLMVATRSLQFDLTCLQAGVHQAPRLDHKCYIE